MSWWGKILGGIFGYLVDGPFTALLGVLLGHALDSLGNSRPKKTRSRSRHKNKQKVSGYAAQVNYFSSTFSVMGHVSKADGHVTADEIRVATLVMDRMGLSKEQREKAISLFNQGKNKKFPLDKTLKSLRDSCLSQKNLLRMFMEIQVMAAIADGEISSVERHLLLKIAQRLGILRMEYERIEGHVREAMHSTESEGVGERSHSESLIRDAYELLGINKEVTDREVKKAYRRLLSQHHPDKLVSKGLPEEMMKLATDKTHEIRQAYEAICAARDI